MSLNKYKFVRFRVIDFIYESDLIYEDSPLKNAHTPNMLHKVSKTSQVS